ncbi:helix-turn-helix transcriptional regulator [Burkholderia anthina]|uniref:helix-turn-helix transcriptional regulator n=1 Tax=Burkholderia anthina TaxID=179879 RepID=UPI00158C81DA|nr:helix-turn-helix transcriptional regulator [Burkholderia anthina]MBY4866765.1 helix-turn-helix transcriptional regulator [Burkholderia anthina]
MSKDFSMRKLLADKVRLWMGRVPAADTQAKLAERAKMSQSSIHRVLNLGTEPELSTAYKLASAFGISIAQLLDDEDGREGISALPIDPKRFAGLPASEKEKIRAFAEFVMATYEASKDSAGRLTTVSETIPATCDEQTLVKGVAQRDLTTDTLSENETNDPQARKRSRN